LVEKLRAQNVEFEKLIFSDEIHDLLRRRDWNRANRATAEFFDRKLAASGQTAINACSHEVKSMACSQRAH
jgi:hypothetical protein